MNTIARENFPSRNTGGALWPFHVGAAADVAVGAGLIAFADPVASLILPSHTEVLAISSVAILRGLGVFLILFALETVLVAQARGMLAKFRSWVVVANWATVALVAGLLAGANAAFSGIGLAAVALVGIFVAAITVLQQRAI